MAIQDISRSPSLPLDPQLEIRELIMFMILKSKNLMELRFDPSGIVVQVPNAAQQCSDQFASSMMDAEELLYLAASLAAFPWDERAIVVEIGTYVGTTAVFMAKIFEVLGRRVSILSIDPFERVQADSLNPQGIYGAYVHNITSYGVASICLPLAAFSQDAALVVPATIGVLIIDGGHHYSIVRQDLELYAPKVLPKGLIFLDDYDLAFPGVVRAVDDYFFKDGPFRILHKSFATTANPRRANFVIAQRL